MRVTPAGWPVMGKALAENRRAGWPLITVNVDFTTNEPAHHAFVLALLRKYRAWLTTAVRMPRQPHLRR